MATRQALTRPTMSICLPLFFVIIMLATGATAAALASPPSVLQLYKHEDQISENRTTFAVVTPNGDQNTFGTVAVFDNVVREGAALDSPVLGRAPGWGFILKDSGRYLTYSYVLDTPCLNGTITVEGKIGPNGIGQLAITGGTGDFLSASGYLEQTITSFDNRQFVVYNTTLYVNYACDESFLFLKK